jgi:DNA-directed RNA polymerase subunit RPC12/RpoP
MPTSKLKVVSKPARDASVLVRPKGEKPTPFVRSTGTYDYVCGNCGATILASVTKHQVMGMTFLCGCGSYNETE